MSDLRKRVRGRIFTEGDKALLLIDEEETSCYLAFALVERGSEIEIFPDSLLDDWGHEIKGFALYEWIQENGIHFPRAEVFGHDHAGLVTQRFLRDLDPLAKYPCYAFEERRQSITDGQQVVAIGVLDGNNDQVIRIKKPPATDFHLNRARVHWWRIGRNCSTDTILATIADSL